MTDYVSADDLRAYIGSESANYQSLLESVATTASRAVENYCGRVFTTDTTATARYYQPDDYYCVQTDDIYTTSGLTLATDDGYSGAYGTSWTLDTHFYLEPINQRQGQIANYPYTSAVALAGRWFPPAWFGYRPTVKVTAKWGWLSVPDDVTHACLLLGARLFKMKDTTGGYLGVDGWGPVQMKQNPDIAALLNPYAKSPGFVAV